VLNSISNATPPPPVAQSTPVSSHKSTQAKSASPESSSTTDTVQLSMTAQAVLAAAQEAKETPAQTAKEASGGDRQAQRLLAKHAAAQIHGR
jgi:hypothetical protein